MYIVWFMKWTMRKGQGMTAEMTAFERSVINILRDKGFAITVFYPDELGKESRESIEHLMVETVNEYMFYRRGKE
jgi:hypothetical protein